MAIVVLYEEDFNVNARDIYRDICERLDLVKGDEKGRTHYPEAIEIQVTYGQPLNNFSEKSG